MLSKKIQWYRWLDRPERHHSVPPQNPTVRAKDEPRCRKCQSFTHGTFPWMNEIARVALSP
eukprot:3750617-Amphidinium_carterae.1